jgi:hypothetical protein
VIRVPTLREAVIWAGLTDTEKSAPALSRLRPVPG